MNEDDNMIQRAPFKGKRIEFAPTTQIDRFGEIAEDFMKQIFGFEPGHYLITDESSLFDFTGLDEIDITDIHQKLQDIYELDVSDIPSGNLLEIFTRLHHRK